MNDELLSVTLTDGVKRRSDIEGKDNSSEDKSNYKVVKIGDIAYNSMRMWQGASGVSKYDGIVSPAYTVLKPIADINIKYFASYFKTANLINLFRRNSQGMTSDTWNLKYPQIAPIKISIPNKNEQNKVAGFLCIIDERIEKQQRLVNALKSYKRGALLSLFPKDSETTPKLRFSDFSEPWSCFKFSEITHATGTRNKDNIDLEPYAITNEHGFIRQSDAHEDFGYMKSTDRRAYIIVRPHSFAYNPARINVGSIGYYSGTNDVIVSSLYEVFQTTENVDDRFLWHWFKSYEFTKWIEKLQEGSVRLYFYYDKLCECQMLLPPLEEQRKISDFLDQIDRHILTSQQLYDTLQSAKRTLLQKMFI